MFEYKHHTDDPIVVTASIVVREAVPRDFDAIRAVAAVAFEEFRASMGRRVYPAYLASVQQLEARAHLANILVAEADGEIRGTISLYPDISDEGLPVRFVPGTAGVRAAAVLPAARGHGVGRALVGAAIAGARDSGAIAVGLHTADCMTAAISLYLRFGFRRAPEHDFVVNEYLAAPEDDALLAVAFVLSLGHGT